MPTRLRFRLEEVLPLAEHAMDCRTHRLTAAQARAYATLRPALTLTATATGDMLRSNGVPVWYDDDGQVHAATAYTWRHPATGRRGSSAQPRHHNAYLPLDDAAHAQPSVIDLLRAGRHTDQHWVILDLDGASRHLLEPEAVRLIDHRDDIVPADAPWLPATVTAQAVHHQPYRALVAHGYTTDTGHDLVRFDRASLEQIITDLDTAHANPDRASDPMPGEYPVLRLDGNVLVELWEHDDGERIRLLELDRVHPDHDGRYSLGAHRWPWRLAMTTTRTTPTGKGETREC